MVGAASTSLCIRAELPRAAPDEVVEWRFDELERLGVEPVSALRLALEPSFDVAAVRRLVASGCGAALAVSIVL